MTENSIFFSNMPVPLSDKVNLLKSIFDSFVVFIYILVKSSILKKISRNTLYGDTSKNETVKCERAGKLSLKEINPS